MIQTNWVKCDSQDCNLVAWYRASYEDIPTIRNLCQKHLDEYKEMLGNWKIEDLKYE